MKKIIPACVIGLTAALVISGCGSLRNETTGLGGSGSTDITGLYQDAHLLQLKGTSATLDGAELKEFDYTWKVDPSFEGERFEGTEPEEGVAAYIAHDIVYYPEIPAENFAKENYDGEQEWVTRYTAEGLEDYIFSTLPILGNDLPTEMMHSAEEAYNNPVIHITAPGTYIVEGSYNGQLWFDFGEEEDTFANEEAKVTVILNGADVTCTVAPAIVFHDVYECDNTWEDRETYTDETDLSNAGVQVILVDGTENNFSGANVFRLLKNKYKKEGSTVQKKLWKMDGAFYSFQSMRISGEEAGTGILNITSTSFEGLDCELHMTIDGGYVNIFSQDDGINVNEDNVSVFTMNDGHLTIFASLGTEGDVIDSNGFIRVNGGQIAGTSKSPSDELLDSENGTYIDEKATIIYGGSMSENGGMGGPGGMQPPEGFGNGQTPPDGFGNGQAPPDGGQMPEGFDPKNMPGGQAPPEKPDGPQMP